MAGPTLDKKDAIRALVHTAVETFAVGFKARHEGEKDNPDGILNMKIHNVFIAELGVDIQYYSALCRSLDSSLGNMLEALAINLADFSYVVKKRVAGSLAGWQTREIADLLAKYDTRAIRPPTINDYQALRRRRRDEIYIPRAHDSDYYLVDKSSNDHSLIELKIGGDLDNKKARSEKSAILEQFAILSNILPNDAQIKVFFATGYNRYGEGKPWRQERVRQYFAEDELLIGRDFWNFICKMNDGYDVVLDAYKERAPLIKKTLEDIKATYLKI